MTTRSTKKVLSLFAATALLGGCAGGTKTTSAEEARSASPLARTTPGAAAPGPTQSPRPRTPAQLESSVHSLLNGVERVPSDEDWKRLGPDALPVLEKIIAARDTLPSVRSRAISSLSQVQNPDALPRLQALVGDGALEPHLRATAVLALAARAGQPAQSTIAPLLADKNAQVREAAARALGRLGTPSARTALEKRLSVESDPVVREAIEVGLSQAQP